MCVDLPTLGGQLTIMLLFGNIFGTFVSVIKCETGFGIVQINPNELWIAFKMFELNTKLVCDFVFHVHVTSLQALNDLSKICNFPEWCWVSGGMARPPTVCFMSFQVFRDGIIDKWEPQAHDKVPVRSYSFWRSCKVERNRFPLQLQCLKIYENIWTYGIMITVKVRTVV